MMRVRREKTASHQELLISMMARVWKTNEREGEKLSDFLPI